MILGVLCVALGTLASAIGTRLIARGGRWNTVGGNFLCVVVGSALQILSWRWIPESTSAALGGLVVVWTVVLGGGGGGGTTTRRSLLGSLLVLCAAALLPQLPRAPCAGAVGGFTDTLAKAWTFGAGPEWGVAAVVFGAGQIGLLNAALVATGGGELRTNAVYMPSLMISVIVVGAVTYAELSSLDPIGVAVFAVGCAMSVAGAGAAAAATT